MREAAVIEQHLELLFSTSDEEKFLWWIEHMERGDYFMNENDWVQAERAFTRGAEIHGR